MKRTTARIFHRLNCSSDGPMTPLPSGLKARNFLPKYTTCSNLKGIRTIIWKIFFELSVSKIDFFYGAEQ